jgi:DNA-binding CsgD family transcriptional regulator
MDRDNDSELTATIRQTQDISDAGHACRAVARELGFEFFLYGFRIPINLSRPCQFILNGYPREWREHYDRCGYLLIDPVLQRALNTVLPFAWDELDQQATPVVAALFSQAAEYGLKHGISIPVHGAHGEGALLCLARPTPLPESVVERTGLFRRAQWFTAHLHEQLRGLIYRERVDERPVEKLTARERQCLQLAAEGQSSTQIALQANISERTVVFHLTRCGEKLGVRTRQHAIARAVALGEIGTDCYPPQLIQSQKLLDLSLH